MKARNHITFGGLILVVIVFLVANPLNPNSLIMLDANSSISIAIFLISGLVGTILPDSDSKNCGSKIFYTLFFPIAFFVKSLEYPIARLLKRQVKHRGSLHTLVGVALTSILVPSCVFLFFVFLLSYKINDTSLSALLFSISGLFIGQLTHLVADLHFRLK